MRLLLAAAILGLVGCSSQKQVDNIALPFVNDPEVIGKWETVDFVRTPDDFKPGTKSWPEELAVKDLVFSAEGKTSQVWTWTKGVLIHSGDKTASEYVIKSVGKTPYLFFQWKSGDYIRHGKEPWYYVLRKAK